MKKFVLAIFMAACVSGMHAQTKDVDTVNINVEAPSEELAGTNGDDTSKNSGTQATNKDYSKDIAELISKFNAIAQANQPANQQPDYSKIYFPVEGKSKFMRRHHIVQQMSISALGGGDNGDDDDTGDVSNDNYDNQQNKYDDKGNFGFSTGLTFLFVPGVIEGDQLRINRFGMGYSTGLIASFDSQQHYGMTFDFMLKLGVETGYSHKMGMGFDLLFGTGKSGGVAYTFDLDQNTNSNSNTSASASASEMERAEVVGDPYTEWCMKYGAQLWVRSSLLNTGINNTNVRLFVRYVYSKNPSPDIEYNNDEVIINDWMNDSFQIGLEFVYEF